MARPVPIVVLFGGLLILSACAESLHQVQRETGPLGIPLELQKEIDTGVTFADLRADTDSYLGRTVSLGGIVLAAKRTSQQTELEILQLPRKEGRISTKDRLRSEGRFIAVREEFLDPATVPPGTPVTIIGTVQGSITRRLDEAEYLYPVLAIKHLIDWNTVDMEEPDTAPAAFYGPYYYPPFGYWGVPYGYYPFWTRPYPFIVQPRPAPRPPPSPPPSGIPPRFKRR
ncbi:Slp family lipoprotein [Candidatus Nitrospira inopinata]|jgi:outer membrane lipoprotein|uniref:Putative Outer membrane lipoprotein Slp (Modular protein) n=1 Tax=Candidatus Nitrospira inopinata TaxID=1715989 RepID=A0A0S4KYZ2_9BACT|nr:Slp family lipoprotein [Candidatus Nitrospira inopinata]CUQ67604.1 Putative Outer membrane lipoprotein Slp (modular protein) [Candidatus Nitrospira inopinata]